jgi:hypothetical protein
MKAVKLRVQGKILSANGRYALLLQNANPERDASSLIYLRFAFITMGVEAHIFPSFLLDDWGSEIKSLELYNWIDEFAPQFPRAELFGFDESGQETQLFLRALEQYSKWPCYAYQGADTAVSAGSLIEAILLPDDSVTEPVKMKRPTWVKLALRRAQVKWWQVPQGIQSSEGILT